MAEDQEMQPTIVGRVRVYGEEGEVQIDPAFLVRVGELTPANRRLALAHACTIPWQNNPAEMPASYKRELEVAACEAGEEDRAKGREPVALEEVFDVIDRPINEVYLRQILTLSPSDRRSQLAGTCLAPFIADGESPPDWIARNFNQAAMDAAEEHQFPLRGENAY